MLAAVALATSPFNAAVEVAPRTVLFGDPIDARATVVVDTRVTDPESVAVRMLPGPLTKLSERREWSRNGSLAVFHLRVRLACRSAACVPARGVRRIQLPPLSVGEEEIAWPPVDVLPRVPAAAVEADDPPWAVDVSPPQLTFRVEPNASVAVLTAIALAFSAAGLALLALEGRAALAARPRRAATPLERALARVRASLRGEARERRRAVGALARVVAPADAGLAQSAAELAWAKPQPERVEVEELAARVEREVGSR